MDIQGKVVAIYDPVSGTSKSGNEWRKREFLLETPGLYTRKVFITCFGDRAEMLNEISEGQDVVVSVDIESREFNGRWYTNINAYRIQPAGAHSEAYNNLSTNEILAKSNIDAPDFSQRPEAGSPNGFESQADDLPF